MGWGQSKEERRRAEITSIVQQSEQRLAQEQDELKRQQQEEMQRLAREQDELKRQQQDELQRLAREQDELKRQQQEELQRLAREQDELKRQQQEELQRLAREQDELKRQQQEKIARIEEEARMFREEKGADLCRLQKELDERVRQEDVRQIVHDVTSQQLAIAQQKMVDTFTMQMRMSVEVIQTTIRESNVTQKSEIHEEFNKMGKKMVTHSGLQRTLTQFSNPANKGAEEGIQHMVPDADSDDPLLNSTPNNQALFPDSFHESRPHSQQLCDALPSDDSIDSTQPSDKQHQNQTKLLATLDECHQPADGQNHTIVHSRMQLDCTVKQTAV